MYYYGYYFDWTYILVLIGAAISGIASINVHTTYNKYAKVMQHQGLTAQDAAQRILESAGIYDVGIERVGGNLSDHYAPKEKRLRLSDSVYGSSSVAAIGVAAHECGHAVQHKTGYALLNLRTAAVPIAKFGSYLSWPVILLGLLFGWIGMLRVGIFLFMFVVAFQLITLPVEFDASRRALAILKNDHILEGQEYDGAKKVLIAAALTYVAALFTSILQLARLILLARGGGGRRRD